MIFKKKYTRSEWMEGLLQAEELYKDDWSTEGIRREFWDNGESKVSDGAFDYCWYVESNKS